MIRVLIVDDESPARIKIRRFLAGVSDIEVVGEAEDGLAALDAIRRLEPDLVFLDIRMPGLDGMQLVDALAGNGPCIIFATAFADHAVDAYDLDATDYLLKPFDEARLIRALDRARDRLASGAGAPDEATLRRIFNVVQRAVPPTTSPRLLVTQGDRSHFVSAGTIDWIEAEGNYVRLHARGTTHVLRSTLKSLEERLDPVHFVRISRSVIVNLDRVHELRDWSHGDRLVVLSDGTRLRMSRRYRQRLDA